MAFPRPLLCLCAVVRWSKPAAWLGAAGGHCGLEGCCRPEGCRRGLAAHALVAQPCWRRQRPGLACDTGMVHCALQVAAPACLCGRRTAWCMCMSMLPAAAHFRLQTSCVQPAAPAATGGPEGGCSPAAGAMQRTAGLVGVWAWELGEPLGCGLDRMGLLGWAGSRWPRPPLTLWGSARCG